MSQFIANSQFYNITTENEVAIVLSHFNSNFIFDVIRDKLNKKFEYAFINSPSPNVVASFEQNFKDLEIRYPSDIANIKMVRNQTYKEIIIMLCQEYNLQFKDIDGVDYYSLAFYLYDLLLANFINYMTLFFANYVCKEKNYLYDFLGMEAQKKNKDSSTIYNKKIYKDVKLAILNANLDDVLRSVSYFDITFENVLSSVYNKSIVNFLSLYILPINDFFKNSYCCVLNTAMQPIILTNIRLTIQQIAATEVAI